VLLPDIAIGQQPKSLDVSAPAINTFALEMSNQRIHFCLCLGKCFSLFSASCFLHIFLPAFLHILHSSLFPVQQIFLKGFFFGSFFLTRNYLKKKEPRLFFRPQGSLKNSSGS
jgi:hypothetical protein